ncbi:Mfa1 family fimbria major subunit [Porphyromonas sp.]|uniref:Mfa1 family fimbria major subunit n=1 Tax=Porphyromonas sp. TaxID=1924944 RepID=UPI0026DB2643|nr:Mfa1 family fimbria major subunit [Porphyromonas sp.]MDO4695453.1 Mfa1 family fimbria major subunit [Porphyromonas sp.]MDO4770331.1 Mfa1 family fimbria major subunit [Porphyromonas sp.]
MKASRFLLIGAIALGLFACKDGYNKGGVGPDSKESTYAGLFVKNKISDLRNVVDSEADYDGRTGENGLKKMHLLSSVKPMMWDYAASLGPGQFAPIPAVPGTFTVEPWVTEPGQHFMALLLNDVNGNIISGVTIADVKDRKFGSKTAPAEDLKALSTDGEFVMTSGSIDKLVKEGVTKATAETGTDENSNVFTFDVERVVAQGLVAKADALNAETVDGRGTIDLTKLTYTAVNGAVETYLFTEHAGDRTMGADQLYDNYESALHNYVEYKNAQDPAGVVDKLIRLGNINPNLGGYAAVNVADNAVGAKAARGIYFLENSVEKATSWTKENKDYGFYRMAYAKVYAEFIPKVLYYLDGTVIKSKSGVAGATFYQGEKDGLFYETKEAAKKSAIAPDQKAYTYKDGKCAYRALWNRQFVADNQGAVNVTNADTRRNNVYLIEIKGFQTIGMPWDSSDPGDPYLPKPADGEEPTTPDNPDIEKQDTYMRVEAKILKWNLVSRKVILN